MPEGGVCPPPSTDGTVETNTNFLPLECKVKKDRTFSGNLFCREGGGSLHTSVEKSGPSGLSRGFRHLSRPRYPPSVWRVTPSM